MNNLLRQRLINWSLMLSVVLLCLLAMEAIFRVSSLGDRLGWVTVTSVPERVRLAPTKAATSFRIMGLGDSFTIYRDSQGKNYLRVMEKLAHQDGYPVEVINLGWPGIGLDLYEGIARQYIDVLKPNLVTVGLFLGDDIPREVVPPVKISTAPAIGLKEKIKSQAKFPNYVFRLLKQYIPALQSGYFNEILARAQKKYKLSDQVIAARLNQIEPQIIALAKSDAINPWDLVNALILPNRYHELITLDPKSNAAHQIDALFSMLIRLNNFAKKRHIPVVFITIPIRLQVSESDQKYFTRLGIKTGRALIGNTPLQQNIAARMKAAGLHHFDMLPPLKAANKDLFIPMDAHLNNAGQVVAGTQLYQYLKKQNMLLK